MRILLGVLATILVGLILAVAVQSLTRPAPPQAPQVHQRQAESSPQGHEPLGAEYWPPIYGYSLKVGDTLSAFASLVGAVIGALGAALAVVLTLQGQRKDETEKVCAAITIEVAQLARFPLEQLTLCRAIYQKKHFIPRHDLPIVMQTLPATLYLAAAERISRVHAPVKVIAFYTGLVETEKTVNLIFKGGREDCR
jgi:hypothetical protein